jgi:choice-of-anchor A domain-containing protein
MLFETQALAPGPQPRFPERSIPPRAGPPAEPGVYQNDINIEERQNQKSWPFSSWKEENRIMKELKPPIFMLIIAALVVVSLGSPTAAIGHALGGYFDYFNVYSTGSIEYDHSDFQGVAGAQNNFIAGNFQLNDKGAETPYSLYAGGNVQIQDATIWNGGISAAGSVTLQNSWVQQGNVIAGSSVEVLSSTIGQNDSGGVKLGGVVAGTTATLANFYVNGDVKASGAATLTDGQVQGSVQAPSLTMTNVTQWGTATSPPMAPTMNLNTVTAYFKTESLNIYGHTSDVLSSSYVNNSLSLSLRSGNNYFTMTNEQFKDIWGANVSGPSDAKLFINVVNDPGEKVDFDWVQWYLSGGMSLSNILVNFPTAQEVYFTQGSDVDLLMPFATTRFDIGLVTGTLVTGDLLGGYRGDETRPGGQVNLPPSVPEPATFLLFASGLVGVFGIREKCKRKVRDRS